MPLPTVLTGWLAGRPTDSQAGIQALARGLATKEKIPALRNVYVGLTPQKVTDACLMHVAKPTGTSGHGGMHASRGTHALRVASTSRSREITPRPDEIAPRPHESTPRPREIAARGDLRRDQSGHSGGGLQGHHQGRCIRQYRGLRCERSRSCMHVHVHACMLAWHTRGTRHMYRMPRACWQVLYTTCWQMLPHSCC